LVCKAFNNPSQNPRLDHIETEVHYLFSCSAYRNERDDWLRKMNLPPNFDQMTVEIKLRVVLNDPSNVKPTAQFIVKAYDIRSKILNLTI
jgi:hypothetical protein